MHDDASSQPAPSERRHNMALRALIEEMLDQVREMHGNTAVWRAGERAEAEAALATIMARVRSQAGSARRPEPDPSDG